MAVFMELPILLIHILIVSVSLVVSSFKAEAVTLPPNVSVPALFVIGDSIMDTGNNNNLVTSAKSNFPPYGRDLKGGMPTGRFSNGKVPSDIIAEEFNIKELLPAYLDPKLQPSDLPTGVCFASGGAGYDPLTSQLASAISLSDQLRFFKEYIGKLRALVGDDRTNFILANGIVLVVAGTDDIANTYFLARIRQQQYDVPAYTDFMVNKASDLLKELYELGARRIGVFGAPPIGCVPSQRTIAGGPRRDCVANYNEAAKLFNSKLSNMLDSLNQKLTSGVFSYVDIYNPLLDLIVNGKKYGYIVVDRGCCGTGEIEVTSTCNSLTPLCADTSDYIFWDSFHPTEGAYKRLIGPIVQKYVDSYLRGQPPPMS